MPSKPIPCRLFVILASEASKAVIFRRGPHLWTQIILWDTKTDSFTEGQWFKGTLYQKRCDLSPDGSKMIYFAAKHYKARFRDAERLLTTWTAVSRPPYLTALAITKTIGTYDGGGYFGDNNTIYINQGRYAPDKDNVPPVVVEKLNVSQDVEFKPIAPDGHFFYEEGLYDLLLKRRGWQADLNKDPIQWRKDNPNHTYSLFMTSISGFGNNEICQFSLKNHLNNVEFTINCNEWADWDQQGRLVYTHEGKLFLGQIWKDQIESVQLADFNPNKLRLIESPAWAKTWDQV
ncbi:MAG: hypothetical protein ABI947_22385 [Chloroflexota bacterium]